MTRAAFVTGLKAESKIVEASAARAGRSAPDMICAGADAGRAEDAAARLIARGAEAIVSFGLCGGLDPGLLPGTLILAEAVVQEDGRRTDTDPALSTLWQDALEAAGLRTRGGTILGCDNAVAAAAEKSRLHGVTGAAAVDMESHGVGRAAAQAGVPFLILRAVADPAGRDLPPAALAATAPDGGIRYGAVIGALVRRPWDLPAMFRLAGDARAGFAVLERAAPVLLGGG